jgi:hypothetical protein
MDHRYVDEFGPQVTSDVTENLESEKDFGDLGPPSSPPPLLRTAFNHDALPIHSVNTNNTQNPENFQIAEQVGMMPQIEDNPNQNSLCSVVEETQYISLEPGTQFTSDFDGPVNSRGLKLAQRSFESTPTSNKQQAESCQSNFSQSFMGLDEVKVFTKGSSITVEDPRLNFRFPQAANRNTQTYSHFQPVFVRPSLYLQGSPKLDAAPKVAPVENLRENESVSCQSRQGLSEFTRDYTKIDNPSSGHKLPTIRDFPALGLALQLQRTNHASDATAVAQVEDKKPDETTIRPTPMSSTEGGEGEKAMKQHDFGDKRFYNNSITEEHLLIIERFVKLQNAPFSDYTSRRQASAPSINREDANTETPLNHKIKSKTTAIATSPPFPEENRQHVVVANPDTSGMTRAQSNVTISMPSAAPSSWVTSDATVETRDKRISGTKSGSDSPVNNERSLVKRKSSAKVNKAYHPSQQLQNPSCFNKPVDNDYITEQHSNKVFTHLNSDLPSRSQASHRSSPSPHQLRRASVMNKSSVTIAAQAQSQQTPQNPVTTNHMKSSVSKHQMPTARKDALSRSVTGSPVPFVRRQPPFDSLLMLEWAVQCVQSEKAQQGDIISEYEDEIAELETNNYHLQSNLENLMNERSQMVKKATEMETRCQTYTNHMNEVVKVQKKLQAERELWKGSNQSILHEITARQEKIKQKEEAFENMANIFQKMRSSMKEAKERMAVRML